MSRPRRQKEASLSDAIRDALAVDPDVTLWRNSVGSFYAHGGGRVWSGLPRGSADLVGVLAPAGRLLALEVKRPGEVPTFADVTRILAKVGPLALDAAIQLGPAQFAATWGRQFRGLAEADRHVLQQEAWLDEVRRKGGFAAYVTSVEEARAAIVRAREGATS